MGDPLALSTAMTPAGTTDHHPRPPQFPLVARCSAAARRSVLRCFLVIAVSVSPLMAAADVMNMSSGLTSLKFVTVGDAGNAADTRTMTDSTSGYGAVSYTYSIGTYAVTNAQYAEFLNAKLPNLSDAETGFTVAPSDSYGLYNSYMETNGNGGISYDAVAGIGQKFSVKSGCENKPVVFVSWYDAIRFSNWLTNGQGNGDTESGTYTITAGGQNSGTVTIPSASQRAAWASQGGPHYFLPSEDEWYKAAYYKGGSATAGYWLYPTQSNTAPTPEQPPGNDNSANFYSSATGYVMTGSTSYISTQDYLTDVGGYSGTVGPYGTFDQAGNAMEWNEGLIGALHNIRGGSWRETDSAMGANYRVGRSDAESELYANVGFRVASVPEPGSIAMALAGAVALLAFSRRRSLGRLAYGFINFK